MGVVRCGGHGRRNGPKCCWRCDRCPSCNPEMGRLLRGDYCRECTEKNKAEGLVWSENHKNWVTPETKKGFEDYLQQELIFKTEHANDYLVLSAFGDWHKDVPEGFVGVFAGKGGRTENGHYPEETRWVLVPKSEYDPKMVVDSYPEIKPLA